VLRGFDDDFVRADAVHFVEEAFAFAVEIAFDAERREAVGYDANVPAGSVGAAAVAAVDENFRRSFVLRAGTEGAILGARDKHALAEKVGGALSAIGGDDHPSAGDGVFSQLGQSQTSSDMPDGDSSIVPRLEAR
jgi:hypothetical protein